MAVPKNGIAYNDCFYKALERPNLDVINCDFSGSWIINNIQKKDFIHLHWPSFLYADNESSLSLFKKFIRFIFLLMLIKSRGGRLLWTAHNLMPHACSRLPIIDILGRKMVITVSYKIFVHGSTAASILRQRFPASARKLVVIDHGHWIDLYPRLISRDEARDKLNLSYDDYVYLFIGSCKEYKNIEQLIEAFNHLPDKSKLIIAGHFQKKDYLQKITMLASSNSRILLYPHYVPNNEIQTYLSACNTVVVPYREILTSGTAMLAISFGRPVVSIRAGYLIDTINEHTGLLYEPDDGAGLRKAMTIIRKRNFNQETIISYARQFDWQKSADTFINGITTP